MSPNADPTQHLRARQRDSGVYELVMHDNSPRAIDAWIAEVGAIWAAHNRGSIAWCSGGGSDYNVPPSSCV